jgi:hypothetical protein
LLYNSLIYDDPEQAMEADYEPTDDESSVRLLYVPPVLAACEEQKTASNTLLSEVQDISDLVELT